MIRWAPAIFVWCAWLITAGMLGWPANSHAASGGIQARVEFTLGTHNIQAKLGVFAFAAAEGAISTEGGVGGWCYFYARRFGARTQGHGCGYEAFVLAGIGKNENLLGSTVSRHQADAFYRARPGDYAGIGFGISRDQPSGSLRKFGVRQGQAIIRVAAGDHSLHLNFANDLRIGPFRGAASDEGPTGSLHLGYASTDGASLRQFGLGLELFTPVPDYSTSPDNPQNSEDGAKRVWFTTPPWENLFYANLYVQAGRQRDNQIWSARLGVDSMQLGALIQNTIHDSFGLYPRYPWPVQAANQAYVEVTASAGDLR
ncbi:MAG: hypothetical protein AAF993_02905 [Pseudomonadota bacterium]